ncbi:hypothetical protein ABZ547_12155 [Streptomyces sparsogenes]|uniref:hypothetical protein n=1 Tax=Streptomyces sparsogenes TaxID=67365 RepID=UPI0033CB1D02
MKRKAAFKRAGRTLPALVGGAVALTLYTAGPALADGQACYPNGCGSSPAAGARWVDYGDIMYIHDYKPDGKATVGQLQYYEPGEGWYTVGPVELWNRNGYDGPPAKYNLEVPEGKQVRYSSCLGYVSGSTCTDWKYEVNDG